MEVLRYPPLIFILYPYGSEAETAVRNTTVLLVDLLFKRSAAALDFFLFVSFFFDYENSLPDALRTENRLFLFIHVDWFLRNMQMLYLFASEVTYFRTIKVVVNFYGMVPQ